MIIIVFGLAAAGKTYVGQTISKYFDFHHEDADLWLSSEMEDYVNLQKHFTSDMLDTFTNNIIKNIDKLLLKHKNLVISQALYRTQNRLAIQNFFLNKNQDILFVQIEASDSIIYNRLVSRGDWVTPNYAASMRQFFQPMNDAIVINNEQNGEEPILKQLYNIKEIADNIKK